MTSQDDKLPRKPTPRARSEGNWVAVPLHRLFISPLGTVVSVVYATDSGPREHVAMLSKIDQRQGMIETIPNHVKDISGLVRVVSVYVRLV